MEQYKLGEMEQKFADLIWEKAPVSTGELVKLCEEAFSRRKKLSAKEIASLKKLIEVYEE